MHSIFRFIFTKIFTSKQRIKFETIDTNTLRLWNGALEISIFHVVLATSTNFFFCSYINCQSSDRFDNGWLSSKFTSSKCHLLRRITKLGWYHWVERSSKLQSNTFFFTTTIFTSSWKHFKGNRARYTELRTFFFSKKASFLCFMSHKIVIPYLH